MKGVATEAADKAVVQRVKVPPCQLLGTGTYRYHRPFLVTAWAVSLADEYVLYWLILTACYGAPILTPAFGTTKIALMLTIFHS